MSSRRRGSMKTAPIPAIYSALSELTHVIEGKKTCLAAITETHSATQLERVCALSYPVTQPAD